MPRGGFLGRAPKDRRSMGTDAMDHEAVAEIIDRGYVEIGGHRFYRHDELTGRQKEVLLQAARGLSVDESAAETGHSPETVRSHRHNIIAALGARNIAHAVHIAHVKELL